jgi:hypothetical protein
VGENVAFSSVIKFSFTLVLSFCFVMGVLFYVWSFNRRQQVLGVFEWSGNNPMPPEMWLLPYLLPVHPGSCLFTCPFSISFLFLCFSQYIISTLPTCSYRHVSMIGKWYNIVFPLQEGCGVTAGWSICLCPTYMGRGLLAQSLQ